MRLAAMAALLAVAHGTAAHAIGNARDCVGCGDRSDPTGAMSASDRQSAVVAARSRELVRETQQRDADARCGCNSTSGGQAARAGF